MVYLGHVEGRDTCGWLEKAGGGGNTPEKPPEYNQTMAEIETNSTRVR